ncbi:MAG: phosphotransferase [Alphaproteobacteria bacterium]
MKPAVSPKGWTILSPVGQDASTRSYSRIEKNGRTAILMDCSRGDHNLDDYIRIAGWLNEAGLSAPEIYEKEKNYLIIEDFGDLTFKKALAKENPGELYALAADVLNHLRAAGSLPALPGYYDSNVHKGHRRVIDWYAPTVKHAKNPDGLAEEYLNAWAEIEKNIPPSPEKFIHADFHVENLMFLPGEKGLKRCGILDFQGAMKGPALYDLGNLLEDVRTDVPLAIQEKYAPRDPAYRVLATQFHCRVVGQFIKMAAKDHKTGYLQYIPRTQAYIQTALQNPLLKPLKNFFDKNEITFDTKPDLTNIKSFVRPDAV